MTPCFLEGKLLHAPPSVQGAEPHLNAFGFPRPVSAPSVPTNQGDQNQYGLNWVPTAEMSGESSGEYSCTLHYTEL